mgnify:CR=1 FL=1
MVLRRCEAKRLPKTAKQMESREVANLCKTFEVYLSDDVVVNVGAGSLESSKQLAPLAFMRHH